MRARWRSARSVSLRIRASRVPLLQGALECVRAGYVPGGLKANREFAESCVEFADAVPEEVRTLLYDPQTAGGLLISVAEKDAEHLVTALRNSGIDAVGNRRGHSQAKAAHHGGGRNSEPGRDICTTIFWLTVRLAVSQPALRLRQETPAESFPSRESGRQLGISRGLQQSGV